MRCFANIIEAYFLFFLSFTSYGVNHILRPVHLESSRNFFETTKSLIYNIINLLGDIKLFY